MSVLCCNKRGDPSVAQLGSARVVVAGAQNEVGKAEAVLLSFRLDCCICSNTQLASLKIAFQEQGFSSSHAP